jgi:three-Cys-motif partner protein
METGCEFLFVFNELHPARFGALQTEVAVLQSRHAAWPENVKVQLTNQNFVELAEEILTGIGEKNLAPTFAFLDPFGYKDVPMELIARLLAYRSCELFIYFDYNSVSRFASAGNVDDHLEALYGTAEFKLVPPAGDPGRKAFLHDLYQRQLTDVCQFSHVQSFEMVNAQGRTGNYLFFCTNSLVGLDRMKSAMWKIAPSGDYRFSDILAGQQVMFELEPDTALLRDTYLRVFAGQTVSITTIEEFTIARTPFVSSHVKRRTLAPMQKAGDITVSGQRRAGTFPNGTMITFPAASTV